MLLIEPFSIDKKAKIAASDDIDEDIDYDQQLQTLKQSLPDRKQLTSMKLKEIEFEKADDTNFHMDFIQTAANLRARNY